MHCRQLHIAASSMAIGGVLCLAACGTPGAPLPPSLNLPTPAQNLSALRIGSTVRLSWTMPRRTTDNVALRGAVAALVCRGMEDTPCTVIATLNLAPGATGAYSDDLTGALAEGPHRLLRYTIETPNRAGKSSGSSSAAFSAAGAGPAALIGLTGQIRADGVLLAWQPAPHPGPPTVFRIERVDTAPPVAEQQPKSFLGPTTLAAMQTLAVTSADGLDPAHAIDASAAFNRQYRYTVERIVTLDLSGHSVEIEGTPSETILVATADRFAPAVPQGLAAVADSAAGAIDLSWTPDTEADLAAYHVYRRDTQGSGQAAPIATVEAATSFRDTNVQPGHTYAYSLSASDQNHNESERSPDVEEILPAR